MISLANQNTVGAERTKVKEKTIFSRKNPPLKAPAQAVDLVYRKKNEWSSQKPFSMDKKNCENKKVSRRRSGEFYGGAVVRADCHCCSVGVLPEVWRLFLLVFFGHDSARLFYSKSGRSKRSNTTTPKKTNSFYAIRVICRPVFSFSFSFLIRTTSKRSIKSRTVCERQD
jgi:hypothetical protein